MTDSVAKKRKMGERKETTTCLNKTAPKWPSIKPKNNLHITRLRDFDLFTVQNFFSSSESKAFIETAEGIGFSHQGSLGPAKGEAYRDNDRISVNDPVLADSIWDSGLNKLFSDVTIRGKVAVGLNPNIRLYSAGSVFVSSQFCCGFVWVLGLVFSRFKTGYESALWTLLSELHGHICLPAEFVPWSRVFWSCLFRYKVGQRFGRHIDESNDLGDGKKTRYTLLVYLSDGLGEFKSKPKNDSRKPTDSSFDRLVGGETVFYGSRNSIVAEVAPIEGMALLHIHGDKCLLHEARNVTKGVKYVFRSDVVFA